MWRFHVVPHPSDENFGTWGLNGWQDRRGPGVWVPMTVDPVNDLVFVPLGNATDQNFGNSRPGENLYATTLLVLQASTGKRKWHFQLTHHDIYDWDVSSPPALIEATKDGQRVPAVAQMTKQGLLFMFHRLTGEPLFGVEERPIPRFDAPGDQAWPTQPFPVKPVGLTRDSMTRKEVSKISPEAEKYCTELFDKSVNMGPYTPYGMLPSLVFPGSEGGGGWGGVAGNPSLGLVFVNTRHLGVIAQLQPSMSSGVLAVVRRSRKSRPASTSIRRAIRATHRHGPSSSRSARAPGDIVWRTPLGEYPELTAKGILGTGTAVNDGGPIATASGLVFIGSTSDFGFRAFDGKTGKELWKATLDNDVLMTPLSYLGANGKQYVAAVAGGGDAAFHIPRTIRAAGQRDGRRLRAAVSTARTSWTDENSFRQASSPRSPARCSSDVALARAQNPPGRSGADPRAPGAPPRPPTPRPLVLDAYSRFLHWLRTPDEVAEAAIEITCGGLMVTVGTGSAHVDIANVKTELPRVREHDSQARTAGEADPRRRTDGRGRERRSAGRHDGPARRHALLARHRQLRLDEADPAAARRHQARRSRSSCSSTRSTARRSCITRAPARARSARSSGICSTC